MKVIYAKEEIPKVTSLKERKRLMWAPDSIFLAGPTPRSNDVASWRPEALKLLEKRGFEGTVLVPEDRDGKFKGSYLDQVEWEYEGLFAAGCVLFWIPRDLETLPGFTTNAEFGMLYGGNRMRHCVLGAPPDAPKTKYLRFLADKGDLASCFSLSETVDAALDNLGKDVDLDRFELGKLYDDYHSDTPKAIRRFLGTHRAAVEELKLVVELLEIRYGPEVALSLEVNADPGSWHQDLRISVNLCDRMEDTVEALMAEQDAFIDAWIDWEDQHTRIHHIHVSLLNWPRA